MAMSAFPIVTAASVVLLDQRDQSRLSELCRQCTDFFALVEGQAGGSETAAELLGPLHGDVTGTKLVFGIARRGVLVGVAELLEGFPGPKDWYVGLLLLVPAARGKGLGTEVWLGLRDWMHGRGAAVVRLVVQKQNLPARAFWAKNGFTVEKEIVGKVGKLESPAWRMVFHLAAEQPG
jgi:ribosomal protein S18 acetylase RimI-like enzyme